VFYPGKYKLTIVQGATFSLQIRIKGGGQTFDLTGCKARSQGRLEQPDIGVLFELSTENGGILLDETAGTLRLYMSAAQTAALDFDAGVYDLELLTPPSAPDPAGEVIRLLQGRVSLSKEVTR
jgi:hypothetical protein